MGQISTTFDKTYPWYSPLRWMGVRKPVVGSAEVSLAKPKASLFSMTSLARTAITALDLLTAGILLVFLLRALACMFIREIIAHGVEVNAYVPAPRDYLPDSDTVAGSPSLSEPTDGERAPKPVSHSSIVMDRSWDRSVFLKRTLSPTGGVPSAEAPAVRAAFLSRLLHQCLVMDRYSLAQATVQLDAAGGRRFVRWELKAGEVICFDFAQVVGWTDCLRFDTVLCLQIGMLAQGKVLLHRAYGPGSIIFEINGEPSSWNHHERATFTADRMVAFRMDVRKGDGHPDFGTSAAGGTLNSLIGTVSQQASESAVFLLDPLGRRTSSGNPVFDLLRHTYRILG